MSGTVWACGRVGVWGGSLLLVWGVRGSRAFYVAELPLLSRVLSWLGIA
jgi:hypothetical protein